eukprot:CAMPEP_0117559308 /NCGR_PEP_ID=MMETSP0784-20121206/53291_1 /TAXON_ID=39447 /ORGANISM="" /LENGTH=140 /DNA_ID=CAMNT_0005356677 /DNA_START=84 /DNA_END=506 /DNA_ORIENTATION=+
MRFPQKQPPSTQYPLRTPTETYRPVSAGPVVEYRSPEDHEQDVRASWRSKFLRKWEPHLSSRTTRDGIDAPVEGDASFTRWLSPSLHPKRIEGRHTGCRNNWQHMAWADEARAKWMSGNPKSSWFTHDVRDITSAPPTAR